MDACKCHQWKPFESYKISKDLYSNLIDMKECIQIDKHLTSCSYRQLAMAACEPTNNQLYSGENDIMHGIISANTLILQQPRERNN